MLLLNSCSQYISVKIVFYLFTCVRKKMVSNKCYLIEYICAGGTWTWYRHDDDETRVGCENQNVLYRVVCIKTFILQYYRTFLYSVVQQGCYKKCYLFIKSLSPDSFFGLMNKLCGINFFGKNKPCDFVELIFAYKIIFGTFIRGRKEV